MEEGEGGWRKGAMQCIYTASFPSFSLLLRHFPVSLSFARDTHALVLSSRLACAA